MFLEKSSCTRCKRELNTTGNINSSELNKELLKLIKRYKLEPGKCKGVNVSTRLKLEVVS
jgi:hypothetical protein